MDETPIKAGKAGKGKLKQAWFWPLYGEQDEVVFTYSSSRGRQHIEQVLRQQFSGTLISDGYAAYARYAEQNTGVTHTQCWVHSRRQFLEAESREQALRVFLADPDVPTDTNHLERALRPIPMAQGVALLLDRVGCRTRLHHPKPDHDLQTARHQCVHLPDGCVAANQ